MQIQQSTYGELQTRTKGKFPSFLNENTPVFLARKNKRIVGTAFVRHMQDSWYGFENRELECTISSTSLSVQERLEREARLATRHLKRRFETIVV